MSSAGLPSVSVVVAARNAEATVGDCAASLLALRYPTSLLEIVFVDNGSADGTRRILAGFGDAFVIAEERRRGPAAARNTGIRRAGGDVIALVDADSTADPDWLEELVPPLGDPTVGIVGGTTLARRPANGAELFGEAIHDQAKAILHWRPPYVASGNWAGRRSVLDEVGLFDELLLRGSDVDFSYRVLQAGYRLAFSPGAVVYHRNERSLAGLFREGWVHGRHGITIARRYAQLIEEAGLRPREPAAPGAPAPSPHRHARRFRLAFLLGKRAGRAAGELGLARGRL
jgi:glycosyltransferase involved in cell wall biosynthesis